MARTFTKLTLSILVTLLLTGFGLNRAVAQQVRTESSSSTGLKRVFSPLSTDSTNGPLSGFTGKSPTKNLILFWSEPPSNATGSNPPGDFHFQIMSYLRGQQSLSADQRLVLNDSLMGDSVSDASTGSMYPAITGNKNSIVLAGDMTGDSTAEIVSVWETAQQKVFASVHSVNQSDVTFLSHTVTGEMVGNLLSSSSNPFSGQICAKLVDVTGNGQKDLIIAYPSSDDNKVHIVVYAFSSSAASHLTQIGEISDMPMPASPANNFQTTIAIAAGRFSHNGRDEIALAGFKNSDSLYVKLYSLEAGNSIVAHSERDFEVVKNFNGGDWVPSQLLMSCGDFGGNGYDDNIVLDINGINNSRIFIARPTQTLDSVIVSTDSSNTNYSLPNSGHLANLDCGDLTGNGKDEIVLGNDNQVIVFKVVPNGRYFKPLHEVTSQKLYTDTFEPVIQNYCNSSVKTGDLNNDGRDEIVLMSNQYTQLDFNLNQSLYVAVYAVTDTSNYTLSLVATKTDYQPVSLPNASQYVRHVSVALGSIAGFSLGKPNHFVVNSVKQPLVVLNAPPVHFDVFNNKNYDINGCFTDVSKCQFYATYDNSVDQKDIMKTNVSSSWGLSSSLSAKLSGVGGEVSAGLKSHYGVDFSKIQNLSHSVSVSINTEARIEDEICALITNYDLWEYPVYRANQLEGHVLVTVPQTPHVQWFSTQDWSSYSYIPNHVPGNVLSYQTYSDSLENNPDLLEKIKGAFNSTSGTTTSFLLDATNQFTWGLTLQDFKSVQWDTTKTYSLKVSAHAKMGAKFFGIGTSIKAGVEGDYSHSDLTSHTSSVTNTLGLTVQLGTLAPSIGEAGYTVTPYAYWDRNGALVLDYAVNPNLPGVGTGNQTWWSQFYGQAPDPALALPFLYWPEEPIFTAQSPNKVTETQSIYSDPENPKAGEQVTTTARIHNYSLIPTAGPVQVSFYIGDPDSGGTVIRSISGDSVFSTDSYIPSRGAKTVSFTWTAPQMINSKFIYDGNYTHIYAVVDPENKIREIHENNNKGWSILQVTGVSTPIEKNPADGLPATVKLYPAYPNPFNPTTTIHYELPAVGNVRLTVYDVLGRRVAQLVSSRQSAGNHEVRFNATQMASGLYFYRLQVNNVVRIGKMMLIK